jgi:hypothetical protein
MRDLWVPLPALMISLLLIMSCDTGTGDMREMEGTWSLSYEGGTGSFDLAWVGRISAPMEMDLYMGTGILNGTPFTEVFAGHAAAFNFVLVTFANTGDDTQTDYIDFEGSLSGNQMSGSYDSGGAYAHYGSGFFTASR